MSNERNETDAQLAAAIAAVPLPAGPPDLGPRVLRRLRRRRVAARSLAGAAALAVVGAGWLLWAGRSEPEPAGDEPTLAGQLNEFTESTLAAPPPVARLDLLHQQQDALLEELRALER